MRLNLDWFVVGANTQMIANPGGWAIDGDEVAGVKQVVGVKGVFDLFKQPI